MKKGEMLNAAIVCATNAHAGQFDRGGKPYILHCINVMMQLGNVDEELQCISILHDTIEDTHTTYQDLRSIGMSERVITGVKALTKVPGETYDEYKQRVFELKDAMIVKQSDLQHNSDIRRLKGVTQKDIERMVKYQVFYMEISEKLTAM